MTLGLRRSEAGKKQDREHLGQKGRQVQKLQGRKGLMWMRSRRPGQLEHRDGENSTKGLEGGALKLMSHSRTLEGSSLGSRFAFLKGPCSCYMENRWGGGWGVWFE